MRIFLFAIDFLIEMYYNKEWLNLHARTAVLYMQSDTRQFFLPRCGRMETCVKGTFVRGRCPLLHARILQGKIHRKKYVAALRQNGDI